MRERRPILALAPVALASVLASGCASLRSADDFPAQPNEGLGAILVSDGLSAPPSGIVEFCLRSMACAEDTETAKPGDPPNGALVRAPVLALATRDARRASAGSEPTPFEPAAQYQLLLRAAARREATSLAPSREPLSADRWRQLVATNRAVNHAIASVSDQAQFGVAERWSMPLINAEARGGRPQGDCEDYALEKRARLIALGWAPHTVSLAIARLPAGTLHTVLVAQTDRGDFVLDNLHPHPRAIAELNYEWLSRQMGAELWVWGAAMLVSADSPHG